MLTGQVLLVDDSPDQLRIRELLLRKAGVECCVAVNAGDALALLKSDEGRSSIGAVITDHLMPGISGLEFVRQIRSFNSEIPVIVLSGLPDAEEEYAGLNVSFLLKPCEPGDMIALLIEAERNPGHRASA